MLLEIVRDFARSRLTDPDVARRHAHHFAALVERAEPELRRTCSPALMETLDAEIGDLRTALRWGLAHAEPVLALRLASDLHPYWAMRNLHVEGRRWLAEGLELAPEQVPDALRAKTWRRTRAISASTGARTGPRQRSARASSSTARSATRRAARTACTCSASVRLWFHRVDEAYALASEAERLAVESGAEETRIEALQTRAMMAPTLKLALEIEETRC